MPSASSSDQAAIAAIIQAEDAAWAAGDAVAFSRAVLEDCVFTNIFGQVFEGQAAFQAQHAHIFSTIYSGTTLRQKIAYLRFVTPAVAVVDTEAQVQGLTRLPPGVYSPDGALHTRLLQVFVKVVEGWMISSYHNVDVKPPPGSA